MKNYNIINKNDIQINKKEYYQNKKHEILEKLKIKFTCICGAVCNSSNKLRHENSIKHQKYLI
jgi:hypothetical protein